MRDSLVSAVRLPSCVGMTPVNWFPERTRPVSAVRLPNCVGMPPVN